MSAKSTFLATLLSAPFLLSACQSDGTVTQAAQVGALKSISEVAAGGVNWAGDEGPFPLEITGGDGYQAAPAKDRSFGQIINAVRTDSGVAPLSYNAKLDNAAQTHANDMRSNNFFSHTGSDGSSVGDRVTAAGYTWRAVGENIAQGQRNENRVLNAWISSPGHHANNVNPNFEEFGLARSGTGSNTTWVLVFAAPQ